MEGEDVPAAVRQKTFCHGGQSFGVVWRAPAAPPSSEGGAKTVPIDDIYGDIEGEDRPEEALLVRRSGNSLQFLVRWQPRDNGFKPRDSVVTSSELRRFAPAFLLDFYERHLHLR